MRFRHINPGLPRSCPAGFRFAAGGGIPPGNKVVPLVQTAVLDPRRVAQPDAFNPRRGDEEFLSFGVGQHWCIGAYIAQAQLTQMFKLLLRLNDLKALDRRVRTLRFNGLFPISLKVRFHR